MAIIKKIREGIKKIVTKSKASRKEAKKIEKQPVVKEVKKDILGAQETVVGTAKFSHPEVTRVRRPLPQDLPHQYEKDRVVLQVRDPWWLHAYWEIRGASFDRLHNELQDDFYRARKILRVYDVTNLIFNGNNANRFFDLHINDYANSWYIDTGGPGRSWCIDLGLLLPDGRFIVVVRSNVVQTPLDGPSWITDEEWMIPDDMFARLYGMGFGLGQSSPGKGWQERMKKALFSGVLASPGMASMASPVKKQVKARQFWMWVDCELIVYGATEPDAKVTVQGREIKLRSDGTFTLRFALPDGRQFIPVKAVSHDQIEERTVTPIVSRETKYSSLVKE